MLEWVLNIFFAFRKNIAGSKIEMIFSGSIINFLTFVVSATVGEYYKATKGLAKKREKCQRRWTNKREILTSQIIYISLCWDVMGIKALFVSHCKYEEGIFWPRRPFQQTLSSGMVSSRKWAPLKNLRQPRRIVSIQKVFWGNEWHLRKNSSINC